MINQLKYKKDHLVIIQIPNTNVTNTREKQFLTHEFFRFLGKLNKVCA